MNRSDPCPNCGAPLVLRFVLYESAGWTHCKACGWDEERQLREKIRDELVNDPDQ